MLSLSGAAPMLPMLPRAPCKDQNGCVQNQGARKSKYKKKQCPVQKTEKDGRAGRVSHEFPLASYALSRELPSRPSWRGRRGRNRSGCRRGGSACSRRPEAVDGQAGERRRHGLLALEEQKSGSCLAASMLQRSIGRHHADQPQLVEHLPHGDARRHVAQPHHQLRVPRSLRHGGQKKATAPTAVLCCAAAVLAVLLLCCCCVLCCCCAVHVRACVYAAATTWLCAARVLNHSVSTCACERDSVTPLEAYFWGCCLELQKQKPTAEAKTFQAEQARAKSARPKSGSKRLGD